MKGVIFTYVLAFGGSALALFDPFIGLLVYIAFAILKPEAMWYWQFADTGGLHFSRFVAIALLIGWTLQGFGRWNFGKGWAIVLSLVLFMVWSFLGVFLAKDPALAWKYIDPMTKIVIPFVVGMTLIDSVAKLKQLTWTIVVSLGYVAFELNLSYYQGTNRVLEDFAGLDNNSIAIMMVSGVGLAFFLGLHTPRWWQKLIAFGCAGLITHVVLFSFSRGGMLALIITGFVSLVLILLIPKKKPFHVVAVFLGGIAGARLAGPKVLERFATVFSDPAKRDFSAQSRLLLWQNCWECMLRSPLFGLGPGHWPTVAHEFGWPPGKEAHSLWMQVGAENGFPGLVFLGLFYLLCVIRLLPLARERVSAADPWLPYFARMIIASLVGFAISAQFVSLMHLEVPYYIVLVGAGVLKLQSVAETRARAVALAAPVNRPPILAPSYS
jgi:probable O-glycosylation ligase (exosortase A-associated)